MLPQKISYSDLKTEQKTLYENNLEDMMRFDSSSFSLMTPSADDYTINTVAVDCKDSGIHNELGIDWSSRCSTEEDWILKKEIVPCGRPTMGPNDCMDIANSPCSDFYNHSTSMPTDTDLFNSPVYEDFIWGVLDPMTAPQMNLFKDNLPLFTDLPSTIITGYNHDLELAVEFDGQQCLNSGATASSLMCCVTQNIVLPERSLGYLPDLAPPDEFVSSDEDNGSAVDDRDYSISENKPFFGEELAEIRSNEVEMTTEGDHRQVKHNDKRNQQNIVKQLGQESSTEKDNEVIVRRNKIVPKKNTLLLDKFTKSSSKEPLSVNDDQSDYEKRTRKNYDREVIHTLMSWYLNHNGKTPDSLAKAKIFSTWFQNAKRRYSRKLETYNSYSKQYPDLVYDSESLDLFLKTKKP